jgi:hypothetical protein
MRTATGLALLAAGAILTFAVSARVPGINLQLAGLILMATGIAGMIVPSRASAWLWDRMVHHGDGPRDTGASGDSRALVLQEPEEADDFLYPAYLLQDPAVLAAEVLNSASEARAAAGGARPARAATARAAQRWTPEVIGPDDEV